MNSSQMVIVSHQAAHLLLQFKDQIPARLEPGWSSPVEVVESFCMLIQDEAMAKARCEVVAAMQCVSCKHTWQDRVSKVDFMTPDEEGRFSTIDVPCPACGSPEVQIMKGESV